MIIADEKPNILIVDDECLNINMLVAILKDKYHLKVAKNGAQALERASSEPRPDIILLDIQMPDMSGYEVCKQLKENPDVKGIPVIFITAMSADTDEEQGLELGAVDYITKPFNSAIVKTRIKNHLELKLQRDQLRQLAIMDGLTNMPNRRRFDFFLEHEWWRAARTQSPLSLILLDIDHFKNFNDNHGHLAGDVCLRMVAKTVMDSLDRSTDFAARYGGEEFVCVLPDTGLEGALNIAEKIRKNIAALEVPNEQTNVLLNITASLGVSSVVPSPDLPYNTLVEVADKRLYEAKQSGRNCVAGGNSQDSMKGRSDRVLEEISEE